MLFISRQDRELFAPNGIWGSTCYVLPDEKTKSRLKRLYRIVVLATFVVMVVAAIINSWWALIAGVITLVWVQVRCVKYICRHCDTVEEKITLKHAIEEYAKSRKPHELWIIAILFPLLAAHQGWKLFNNSDDMVLELVALFIFVVLSLSSIYAVIVNVKR